MGPAISQYVKCLNLHTPVFELNKFHNLTQISCEDYDEVMVDAEKTAGLVTVAPQLTYLKLTNWSPADPNLLRILETAVNLVDLHLSLVVDSANILKISHQYYCELATMMEDPTRVFFPKLKSINFCADGVRSFFVVAFLQRLPKTISKLKVDVPFEVLAEILDQFAFVDDHGKRNIYLKELRCPGYRGTWPLEKSLPLPALETIEFDDEVAESVLMQVAADCHDTLRRFSLANGCIATDVSGREVLRDFFSMCKKLEKVVLYSIFDGSGFVDGLVHENVSEILIYHDKMRRFARNVPLPPAEISPEEFKRIWNQCPKLERLCVDGVELPVEMIKVKYTFH